MKLPLFVKNLDWNKVEAMAQRLSPPDEIRLALGISEIQFRRAVRAVHKKSILDYLGRFYAEGRYILRQKQFEMAEKGNISMLKWLGLQELGQRHHVDLLVKPGLVPDSQPETKDSIPAGFRVLTPAGAEVMIDSAGKVISPEQEKEVPKVEQMLLEEQVSDERRTSRLQGESSPEIIIPASEIMG